MILSKSAVFRAPQATPREEVIPREANSELGGVSSHIAVPQMEIWTQSYGSINTALTILCQLKMLPFSWLRLGTYGLDVRKKAPGWGCITAGATNQANSKARHSDSMIDSFLCLETQTSRAFRSSVSLEFLFLSTPHFIGQNSMIKNTHIHTCTHACTHACMHAHGQANLQLLSWVEVFVLQLLLCARLLDVWVYSWVILRFLLWLHFWLGSQEARRLAP